MGVASDLLWWRMRTRIDKYEKRLEVFEHYHWGIILMIFMKILLKFGEVFISFAGAGVALILAEITQDHPFALRSNHQFSSTIIGISLIVLLVLV